MKVSALTLLTDETVGPVEHARDLEAHGFHALYLGEHTHVPVSMETPYPLGGPLPERYTRLLDPMVALTAAAGATKRLRLGTAVCLAGLHDPIVLAKQIATLDLVSAGRFTLGVGYGYIREEITDHGIGFAERREVVRDHVAVMRALWAQEPVGHEGRSARVSPSLCHPKPRPEPRILIGGLGAGQRLFDHICAYADGWLAVVVDIEVFAEGLKRLRGQWRDAGRDPDGPHVLPCLPAPHGAPGPRPGPAAMDALAGLGVDEMIVHLPSGPREEVLADMREFAALLPG